MLRGRIESDFSSLDVLFEQVGWTPNSACVRPNSESLDQKRRLLENAAARYATMRDYVLARIFRIRASPISQSFAEQKLHVTDEALGEALQEAKKLPGGRKVRFMPNLFPYQVPQGTFHYVLWFLLSATGPPSDQEVDAALERVFAELKVLEKVEYVWYKNPKPTIDDGLTHHVQVFWRHQPKGDD